jgi:RNA polymerase sigma factor (sigma-70 family)
MQEVEQVPAAEPAGTSNQTERIYMRSEEDIRTCIGQYADTVRRICVVNLKNQADTDDIFQNVFFKYAQDTTDFTSEEHRKAWIIRVTQNACKDLLKSFFYKNRVSMEEIKEMAVSASPSHPEVMEAVLQLPELYRETIYLYYYEGYSAVEIASILKKNVNTIYTTLDRAKKQLKEKLGGEEDA